MTCPRPHSESVVELGMEHRSSVPSLEPLDRAPLYLYTFFTHTHHTCTPAHPTPLSLYVQQTAVGGRGRGCLRSILTGNLGALGRGIQESTMLSHSPDGKTWAPPHPDSLFSPDVPPGWLAAANSLGGGGT